jgi:hypothetical protein
MHPEITRALMTERVREAHATAAAASRFRRVRRPWQLPRNPRPRTAWTTRAV